MYLLQRQSDNLYYTNKDYHSRDFGKASGWVSNPNLCRPFRSKTGAINSVGAVLKTNIDPVANGDWDKPGIREKYFTQVRNWYSLENRAVRMKVFKSMYKLIPIKITVETI